MPSRVEVTRMLSNFWEFLRAVFGNWVAIVPGAFGVIGVLKAVWENFDKWLGGIIPQEWHYPIIVVGVLLGLIWAVFLAFHEERMRHKETSGELQDARAQLKPGGISKPEAKVVNYQVEEIDGGRFRHIWDVEILAISAPAVLIAELKGVESVDVGADRQFGGLSNTSTGMKGGGAYVRVGSPHGRITFLAISATNDRPFFQASIP